MLISHTFQKLRVYPRLLLLTHSTAARAQGENVVLGRWRHWGWSFFISQPLSSVLQTEISDPSDGGDLVRR